MRIIHGQGYSLEDRLTFRPIVVQNILDSLQTILKAMDFLQVEPDETTKLLLPKWEESLKKYSSSNSKSEVRMDQELVDLIKNMWNNPCFQTCCQLRNKFHLTDSVDYFMNDLDRITQAGTKMQYVIIILKMAFELEQAFKTYF